MNFLLRFDSKSKLPGLTGEIAADAPVALAGWEKIVWVFFTITCLQLVFQHPSTALIAGERTNLFSGLLCFITLMVAVAVSPKDAINPRSPAFLFSVALALLAAISALSSATPFSSSCRVFVLLASGLGGFWCARILLHNPANQRRFLWLSLGLLGGLLLLSFISYLSSGYIERFICSRSHPLTNVILLLSFAPLKYLALIFVVMALVVALLHQKIIWHKLSRAYPAYRVENLFFSWSIARQHPWLGIGLRTPRAQYLKGYQVKYPDTDKKQFAKNVREIVSADNQLLSFLAGMGFPFTLTYVVVLGILLARLIGMTFSQPARLLFHPLALLLPLSMALVHFQFFDGLLFPQCSWFFHLLLGLIPARSQGVKITAGQTWESLASATKTSIS
ncbi:MAG: O-antigen ligase family protein [Deltaproteobacteria bacterium]